MNSLTGYSTHLLEQKVADAIYSELRFAGYDPFYYYPEGDENRLEEKGCYIHVRVKDLLDGLKAHEIAKKASIPRILPIQIFT